MNTLEQRNRELSILNTIAQALNAEVDLAQALNAALEQVVALFNLQTGWVWLISEEQSVPYLAAVRGLPPALANDPRRMDGKTYCYCLDKYQRGDLYGAANISIITCTRLKSLMQGTDGLRYHTSIPLYAHGKNLGILNVVSTDWHELSSDDLRLLNTIGEMVSIAIERARLFDRSAEIGAIEERNRLAREIHDTLAQSLSAIALQLESADALLEMGLQLDRVREMVGQALRLTRSSLEDTRRSVMDLRAAPLEGRTLPEALRLLADAAAKKGDFQMEFSAVGEYPLPSRVEVGLYRIAQEALNNVVRHAQAKTVYVELMLHADDVTLIIEDDGVGFDPGQVAQGRYGLIGLNERVRLLGGMFTLYSEPGEGACLEIYIDKNTRS